VTERVRAWLVVLAAAGLAVAAVVVLRTGETPSARPGSTTLASPLVTPGAVGGLLPDVTLHNTFGAPRARALRPAVLLLRGPGCECLDVVRQVVAAAARVRVVTYVVDAGQSSAGAETLAAQSGGEAGGFADPAGTLAARYGVRANATLVLVRRDGVVNQVVAAVAPSLRLDSALRALVA
jgi:hypothetical protein